MSPSFSKARLARMHEAMSSHVASGAIPGLVTLLSRRGETHVDAIGTRAAGSSAPMTRDTLFRIASMTKPVTAAAVMILVEECVLRLDEPVDHWLPELAGRRVLRSLDAAIDDTVPSPRPITVRDLLTFRLGHGFVLAPPGRFPIQKAIEAAGLAPGPRPSSFSPDEWMKRLGSLPLVYAPGERWMYHTGSDVLGVLVARASGKSFGAFLKERIFEPLGMRDSGFHVPAGELERLPGAYAGKEPFDAAGRDSRFAKPPAFESGGGGLISTADDYLAFCLMLLGKGSHRGTRVLSRPAVELMTTNQLSDAQRAEARLFFGDHSGWGFGMAVAIRRTELWNTPGRFGWDGGYGTSGYTDPAEELVGILLTQRMMESPEPPRVFSDFWTSTYQALEG
ncbi:MAG TPA: serine hydrolase domain-containing protein [Myxococcota bacterium]|nr:serine hydrolase domain-containing protein [Myxococcota bacterium]